MSQRCVPSCVTRRLHQGAAGKKTQKTETKITFIPKLNALGTNIAHGMCSWGALQSHTNVGWLSWEVHCDCDIKQCHPHQTVGSFLLNYPKDRPSSPSCLLLSLSEAG